MAEEDISIIMRLREAHVFRRGLQAAGSAVKDFAKVSALALVATGAAFVTLGYKAASAASNLSEQINKTSVVFGASAASLQKWSETTATSIGVSQRAALEAAGTFGNMLVPMGFSEAAAERMSRRMVTLGADMASFNNASPEETLDAIRAGLAGETEPLRRFGVFLNDARVKAEALRMGLYSGTGQLTASAKAAATYNLILRDSRKAQGDFARTSDSMANAQRIARAQFEDLSAQVGQVFMPIVAKGLTMLNDGIGALRKAWPQIQPVVAGVIDFITARIQFVSDLIWDHRADIIAAFRAAWAVVQTIYNDVIKPIFEALGTAIRELVPPVRRTFQTISGVVRRTFAVVGPIIRNVAETALPVIRSMVEAILEFFSWLAPKVEPLLKSLAEIVQAAVQLIAAVWDRWGERILSVVRTVFSVVISILQPWLNLIRDVIKTITALITGDWDAVWEGLYNIVVGRLQMVWAYITGAVTLVKEAASLVGEAIVFGITTALSGLGDLLGRLLRGAWDGVGNVGRWFADKAAGAGRALIGGMIDAIRGLGSALKDAFVAVVTAPIRFVADQIVSNWPDVPGLPGAPDFLKNLRMIGLADGGLVTRGGLALVGEAGPELLTLPAGSRVDPISAQADPLPDGGLLGPRTLQLRIPVYLGRRQVAEAVGEYVDDRRARH